MDLSEATPPIDDVFAFCNHIAWQAGGPVLIHDSAWGVIAYSSLHQSLDEGRRSIILRRTVPDTEAEKEILALAHAEFDAGTSSFEIPAYEGVQGRRVVAPIRLLGVLVGSIWIAESAGPLHPDALDLARNAAKQASLYFQLQDDARRREADRFARMLLEGSQDELLLAQYLGIPASARVRVVALWHGVGTDLREQAREVARVLAGRASADHVRFESDDRIYLAFYDGGAADERASAAVNAFTRDMAAADDRLLIGIGRTTTRLGQAPKSRSDADRVIAYLQRTPGERVGSVSGLRTQMSLMRLVEVLDAQFEPLPDLLRGLAPLEPDDRDEALRTLDAYFTHPGNVSQAARLVHVHPNTFRYRLSKVAELLGIDLDDRDSRLALEIELLRHRYGG